MGRTTDCGLLSVRDRGLPPSPSQRADLPFRALAEKQGLKVMTRNHIHCAVGLAGETGVVSGACSSSPPSSLEAVAD